MSEEDQPEASVNIDFQISPMQSIAVHANELHVELVKAGFSIQHAIFIVSQVVIAGLGESIYPMYQTEASDEDEENNDENDYGDEGDLLD